MSILSIGKILNGNSYSLSTIKKNAQIDLKNHFLKSTNAKSYSSKERLDSNYCETVGCADKELNFDDINLNNEIDKFYNESNKTKIISRWLASDNKCTDTKDDGQISFWSKAGNILEGAAKTIVGGAKSLFTNPKKAIKVALAAVLTAILATNPLGLCIVSILAVTGGVKMIYDGTKKIMENVKYANEATTDAEAKDRWEDVGNGGVKVGVGVISTIGGVKGFQNIKVNGASNIAQQNAGNLSKKGAQEQILNDIVTDLTNYVDD